jgi:hypothetical protein
MSTLPHPPNEVLALQYVIENVLSIPPDSEVHSGFKVFWINTINDLMSIKPREDLMLPYFHPTFDEDGEPIDRKCRFHPWLSATLTISSNGNVLSMIPMMFAFSSRFRTLISPHGNVSYYMKFQLLLLLVQLLKSLQNMYTNHPLH